MAQRVVGLEVATCETALVGENQAVQTCDTKLGFVKRIVFKKATGANPFTTPTLLTTEATWDTKLALDSDDDPDNVLLTTNLWSNAKTAGDANIVEGENGEKDVTFYADDVMDISFKGLSQAYENDLLATLRDNARSNVLECMFINDKGQIICKEDASNNPVWIPINLATIKTKNRPAGRGSVETNEGQLHFYEEVLANLVAHTTTGWSMLTK